MEYARISISGVSFGYFKPVRVPLSAIHGLLSCFAVAFFLFAGAPAVAGVRLRI